MSNAARSVMLTALALAVMTGAAPAHAQSVMHVGVIGGIDFATFTGSNAAGGSFLDPGTGQTFSADKGSSIGFVGGLFVDIPAGKSLIFEPALLYAGKGATYAATLTDPVLGTFSGDVSFNLDYIMIPVLLRYNFQPAGGPYALLGPAVSFKVDCTLTGDKDFAGADASCARGGIEATTTTFGGIIGLGFQRGALGAEARYDFDFTDAFSNFSGLKNAAWEIMLRYQFK